MPHRTARVPGLPDALRCLGDPVSSSATVANRSATTSTAPTWSRPSTPTVATPSPPRSTTSAAAASNCSMLEAIEACEEIAGASSSGASIPSRECGDHRWWICNLAEFRADYPGWEPPYGSPRSWTDLRAERRALVDGLSSRQSSARSPNVEQYEVDAGSTFVADAQPLVALEGHGGGIGRERTGRGSRHPQGARGSGSH